MKTAVNGCLAVSAWNTRRSAAWLAGLWCCFLLYPVEGLAQSGLLSTNLPPINPALPDPGFSLIRVFGALALVLALFLAGVWVLKNWPQLAGKRTRIQNLQVLESRALGGRHALYVVGYQSQRLLLASSPAGIALLSHLPAAGASEEEPIKSGGENFVQVLQQAIQQKP